MAGLEVVVRPVVLSNIRPTPRQALPPIDNPEQGWAEIRGNPAQQIDLTFSWSASTSKSKGVETERRVDTARVYQMDDDGEVNEDNFVDIDVANRIRLRGGKGPGVDHGGQRPPADEIANYGGGYSRGERIVRYYKRIEEADNIKIREKDKIQKNPDDPGE
jgi:hypothetical protein